MLNCWLHHSCFYGQVAMMPYFCVSFYFCGAQNAHIFTCTKPALSDFNIQKTPKTRVLDVCLLPFLTEAEAGIHYFNTQ